MNHSNFLSFFEDRRFFNFLFTTVFTVIAAFSTAQVDVDLSDATGDPGDQVEVDVSVENFENMISMQFSVNWDPAVVEFDTFTNLTDEIPFNATEHMASPDQIDEEDAMTVSWLTDDFENGSDIPDGTILFTIVFDVVGEECDESPVELSEEPSAIEFIQRQGNEDVEIMVNSDPGLVNIPGTGCDMGGDLELIGSMETVEPGEEVCVEISVQNFDSILSMQYAHEWDSDVLEFVEVRNFNLNGLSAGSFNLNTSSGKLRLTWNDPGVSGASVPDGTVIYEICFNAVGSLGEMSQVSFTDDPPIALEIIQNQGGSDQSIIPTITDGKVTIEGQFDGPIITAESGSAATGEEFCMDFTVQNFEEIQGVTFALDWDENLLDYLRLENLNSDLGITMGNFNFTDAENGEGVFVWTTPDGIPKTLSDGAVLFTVCYEILGDCDQTVDVAFVDAENVKKEVIKNDMVVPSQFNDAEVEIPCFSVPFEVSDVLCNGECNGAIDLAPTGGQSPYTFEWDPDSLSGEDPQNLCAGTYSVTVTEAGGQFVALDITVNEPDPLNIVIESVEDDDGTGSGSIDLTLEGGTTPYSTTWSGPTGIPNDVVDPTNLASGSYTVTVADDNGCTTSRDIFVPGEFSAPGEVTDACFDECSGAIDVMAQGGTEPYDYFWDGPTDIPDGTEDPSGLCPGDYDLTVEDADGNTTIGSFTVEESDPIEITIDDVQADDDGTGIGSISISVNGGTPSYMYAWDGPTDIPDGTQDPSGLMAGTYTVTVTDQNGCTASEDIVVDPPFSITEVVVTDISCAGRQDGSIDITVAGGEEPYSYQWSNGSNSEDINTLSADSYSVTVTDDTGETISATYEITEPSPLNVDVEMIDCSTTGGQNGSAAAVVSGGTPSYSYEWSSNESDSVATMLAPGINIVIVTDSRGCSIMDTVDICEDEVPIDCYEGRKVITPNGDSKNDRFLIECIFERPNTLRIYNQYGQKIYEQENYDNNWRGTDEDGNEVDEDTYLWVLEVELTSGETKIYRGAVTVLRNLH